MIAPLLSGFIIGVLLVWSIIAAIMLSGAVAKAIGRAAKRC